MKRNFLQIENQNVEIKNRKLEKSRIRKSGKLDLMDLSIYARHVLMVHVEVMCVGRHSFYGLHVCNDCVDMFTPLVNCCESRIPVFATVLEPRMFIREILHVCYEFVLAL